MMKTSRVSTVAVVMLFFCFFLIERASTPALQSEPVTLSKCCAGLNPNSIHRKTVEQVDSFKYLISSDRHAIAVH